MAHPIGEEKFFHHAPGFGMDVKPNKKDHETYTSPGVSLHENWKK